MSEVASENDARMRTVCLPGHVQESGASNENSANTHAMEIVQSVLETLEVAAVPEASLPPVVLERGVEVVVVCGISICELVEEKTVEGKSPPVGRGRSVCAIWSGSVVIENRLSILVGIEVVRHEVSTIAYRLGWCGKEGDGEGKA
jgi:hypothetical protein